MTGVIKSFGWVCLPPRSPRTLGLLVVTVFKMLVSFSVNTEGVKSFSSPIEYREKFGNAPLNTGLVHSESIFKNYNRSNE